MSLSGKVIRLGKSFLPELIVLLFVGTFLFQTKHGTLIGDNFNSDVNYVKRS